ncbi:MAG: histidinol-phosphate aminotransferase, partial [Proteobacteria bacterium]|nr:histidinol-phosphate aminotransferase [Pseudomonadota bacterium]
NFLMARGPMPDPLMYRKLRRKGGMGRTMTGFRFPNWIRVSLVQPPAMEAFCRAFGEVLDETVRSAQA